MIKIIYKTEKRYKLNYSKNVSQTGIKLFGFYYLRIAYIEPLKTVSTMK